MKSRSGMIGLAALLLAALACNAPTGTSDAEMTLTALSTATQPEVAAQPTVSGSEAPAATPTTGPSPTPSGPTPGPQQCAVTATTAVNVRTGPSTYHPILRILGQDQQGLVTGREGSGTWWQIDGNGWVSAAYVTTSGECGSIPLAAYPAAPPTSTPTVTPSPTPTATNIPPTAVPATNTLVPTATNTLPPAVSINFTAGYAGRWKCTDFWRVSFQIANTGSVPLESLQFRVEGPPGTYINGASTNTPFGAIPPLPADTCMQAGADSLAAGSSSYVHLNIGMNSPAGGTAGVAILKFCAANDQGGACKEITVNFTF
jgi:hypothetical protein